MGNAYTYMLLTMNCGGMFPLLCMRYKRVLVLQQGCISHVLLVLVYFYDFFIKKKKNCLYVLMWCLILGGFIYLERKTRVVDWIICMIDM